MKNNKQIKFIKIEVLLLFLIAIIPIFIQIITVQTNKNNNELYLRFEQRSYFERQNFLISWLYSIKADAGELIKGNLLKDNIDIGYSEIMNKYNDNEIGYTELFNELLKYSLNKEVMLNNEINNLLNKDEINLKFIKVKYSTIVFILYLVHIISIIALFLIKVESIKKSLSGDTNK